MRKRLITPIPEDSAMTADDWLDVAQLAQVEVTSEDGAHLIESALVPGDGSGWRAAQPGEQTIRLIFDRPQRLTRIWLLFIEPAITRTQEFVLRWSPDGGRTFHDIVRQQWNFGPPETIREIEDYRVELSGVTVVELAIVSEQRRGDARASLAQLRLAG
jgi:hypothetical protein